MSASAAVTSASAATATAATTKAACTCTGITHASLLGTHAPLYIIVHSVSRITALHIAVATEHSLAKSTSVSGIAPVAKPAPVAIVAICPAVCSVLNAVPAAVLHTTEGTVVAMCGGCQVGSAHTDIIATGKAQAIAAGM